MPSEPGAVDGHRHCELRSVIAMPFLSAREVDAASDDTLVYTQDLISDECITDKILHHLYICLISEFPFKQ
jgi:hypothetical protein